MVRTLGRDCDVHSLHRRRHIHAARIAVAFILVETIDEHAEARRAVEIVHAGGDGNLRAGITADADRREAACWNRIAVERDAPE